MPKDIDLKEIAEKKPRVDLEALEEGRRLREKLCQTGGTRRRQAVLPPDRRKVIIDDDIASDPRVVRFTLSAVKTGKAD